MNKNLQGTDQIFEYMSELINKPNGKYQIARIYGMARREEEINDKEKVIEEVIKLSPGDRIAEVTFIGEEIAIVKVESRKKNGSQIYYKPVVNEKRSYENAETFDRALVIALAEKYGVASHAPKAIVDILQMDKFEAKKSSEKTFIELVVEGETTLDHIDDAIEQWHSNGAGRDMKLHEFLGLTPYEYQEGIVKNKREVLETIVELYNI